MNWRKLRNLSLYAVMILILIPPPSALAKTALIAKRGNLRSGPGTQYRVSAKADPGVSCELVAEWHDWYLAKLPGGVTGWLNYILLEDVGSPADRLVSDTLTVTKFGNLREGPDLSEEVLAKLVPGDRLVSSGQHGDWFEVQTVDGIAGFIHRILIERPDIIRYYESPIFLTIGKFGNLRSGPGTESRIAGKLSRGWEVAELSRSGEWIQIVLGNGTIGWIHPVLLDSGIQQSGQPEPESPVAEIVPEEKQFGFSVEKAEDFRRNHNYRAAIETVLAQTDSLEREIQKAPDDACLRYALARCQFYFVQSLFTDEDKKLAAILDVFRNASKEDRCWQAAHQMLQSKEEAEKAKAEILRFLIQKGPTDPKRIARLSAATRDLPFPVEAEIKRYHGRYHLYQSGDLAQAIVAFRDAVSIYGELESHDQSMNSTQTDHQFHSCMELGIALSRARQYDQASAAFEQAYQLAKRIGNEDWLDYYQKIVESISNQIKD